MTNKQIYTKTITIVNIASKEISPRPGGKVFNPFTVWSISGNDGITYQTTQHQFVDGKKVGDSVAIKYTIETRSGTNGQVYTDYKLISEPKEDILKSQIIQVIERIDLLEKNIISAIRMTRELKPIPEATLIPKAVEEPKDEEETELPF